MNIDFDALVPQLDDDAFVPQEIEVKTEEVENKDEVKENNVEDLEVIDDVIEDKKQTQVAEPDEIATLFYKELVDKGIANESDKENYSWDDVESVINNYKEDLPKQVTEAIILSSPEIGQSVIDYVFSKGDALTKDDLKVFMQDYLDDLETIERDVDFKSEDNARQFLTEVYKSQGIRESQISVMLDVLEDESENGLIEEAKKYAEQQKTKLKSSDHLNQAKIERQTKESEMKTFAESIQNELKNTGWKNNRIEEVRRNLVSGETNNILKKASRSPQALIQLANLSTYYDEKTGKFNFDDFIKQEITPETNQLKEKIKRDMFSSGTITRGQNSNPNRSKFSELVPISPID